METIKQSAEQRAVLLAFMEEIAVVMDKYPGCTIEAHFLEESNTQIFGIDFWYKYAFAETKVNEVNAAVMRESYTRHLMTGKR